MKCENLFHIVFDGGSRGCYGCGHLGYGSYRITYPDGTNEVTRLSFGNNVTNNEAEYRSLIASMEGVRVAMIGLGKNPHMCKVTARGDSLLVVKQVNGLCHTRAPHLILLCNTARELAQSFGEFVLLWHRRENSVSILGH
jgi:probable phosphoglycerate mutase